MSRPGLIVGLGGTGQWVLTWLKRDMLLANNGKIPDNIRFLSIDTATMLEADAKRVTGDQEEEGVEVGGVALDQGEFIYVGGDSKPLAEQVRKGELPHIGKWYHAQRWLDSQNPASFILDDGAGRIRQFGRMAIFKDLQGENKSKLWRSLESAIEAVRTATDEQRRLEIVVVGSFAGGTGSGMFLDVAMILRTLAQSRDVHHVLRGFFALPSVFTSAPDRDMRARTFAAWRELNRFMVIDSDFPMSEIKYTAGSKYKVNPTQRIFDACYLVDGKRGGTPLAEEPKYGAFPMMSEVISAILDEKAGAAYTQWIFTNLAPEYARHPDIPMYSAIGAYTVQVPAHFVQEISSYAFGKDILQQLLQPSELPDEDERLVSSGADRHLSLAAPDKNQEDPGFSGRMRSRQLLLKSVNHDGKSGKPTAFMGRIAELNEQAHDADKRASVTDRLAKAGFSKAKQSASRESWVTYFPDMGGDPEFEATQKNINDHTRFYIPEQYGRRDKESAEEATTRFRKIDEDVRIRLGGVTSGEEEHYGAFGESLGRVEETQILIFQRIVRLSVLDVLMGYADDAIKARSGKLGYAWDYFDGLVKEFEYFLGLMKDVRSRREEATPEGRLRSLLNQRKQIMQQMKGRKFLVFWESPKVKKSEIAYLQAYQQLVNMRREEVLQTYVENTTESMKRIAEEARDSIQQWIWHLATGDDASSLPGLWDGLRKGKQQIRNAHAFDTETDKVQKLLADDSLEIRDEDLAKALGRWEWVVSYQGTPPRLQLRAQIHPEIEGEDAVELENPAAAVTSEVRMKIGRTNQYQLMSLARRNFSGVVARTTVAQAIKETYPDAVAFARQVANVSAEPLFEGTSQASPVKQSNIIRIDAEDSDAYFTGDDGLQGELRYINNLQRDQINDSYGIQVVGSENPYKLTLVRTDDLYHYNHFAAWEDCLEAYADHVRGDANLLDPFLLHNFPAEAKAVIYEGKLTQEYGQSYRPLHPRVVVLLGDTAAMRQFLYLGILGHIGDQDDKGGYRWELNWDKASGSQTFWLTRSWIKDKHDGQRPRPDIFNAMHGYIIMRRTQQPGRNMQIDYEFADRLIAKTIVSVEDEIKLLETNLADDGFVGYLRGLAYDPDVPERVMREDLRDLAAVSEILLKERIDDLRRKVPKPTNEGDTGIQRKGPFAPYVPSSG